MIKLGKYIIDDWKDFKSDWGSTYFWYQRDIFTQYNDTNYKISWIRVEPYKEDGNIIWCLDFYCYTFLLMFEKIHGYRFERKLTFNSPIEGKEFVDNTLKKIVKLKAFL